MVTAATRRTHIAAAGNLREQEPDHGILPNDLTHRERYKVLTGFVLPRPIAWETTIGPTGVVNAAPFSFFNVFCEDPPLCMFAANLRPDGRVKDTISAMNYGTASRCASTWTAIIRSDACSPTATAGPTTE